MSGIYYPMLRAKIIEAAQRKLEEVRAEAHRRAEAGQPVPAPPDRLTVEVGGRHYEVPIEDAAP